ncbi:MAG: VOC family protein, partial [Pseudomonadota bacterium]
VGVEDLDRALELWVDVFGMHVAAMHEGEDSALAALLDVAPTDIARQALLRTGDERFGQLHLVQFTHPGPTVRDGADVFDLCPKNLDIFVGDMPQRLIELRALGYEFRNQTFSEATAPDGTRFREMHMPSHDDVNVVLLELLDGKPPLNDNGYASVGPLIYIVPDAATEKTFLRQVLGLDQLSDNRLAGSEIERMIGLPKGAALEVSIWGRHEQPLGELEIVDYQGVDGADLYFRAKAPSRGILQLSFTVADRTKIASRLQQQAYPVQARGPSRSLLAEGDVITIYSPAGLRIDIWQTP